MKHNHIPRILALLLVIALVVICVILACPPVRAAECRLEGMPVPTPWEPDEADGLVSNHPVVIHANTAPTIIPAEPPKEEI